MNYIYDIIKQNLIYRRDIFSWLIIQMAIRAEI